MVTGFHIVLLLVGQASVCVSQSIPFNYDKLVAGLDKDGEGNISRSDVEQLFTTSFGSNVTGRCRFMDTFINDFQASPVSISVFFDTIQSADKQVTAKALTDAFLGGPSTTNLTVSNLTAVLKSVFSGVEKIISRPADFSSGYTFWPYSQFEVSRWANELYVNQTDSLARMEISAAMRSLDENGDWNIQRCEFINSMALYKQHSATSAKVYDVIFQDRDMSWADVDSDFLMFMMDSMDGVVTKQQFIIFFTKQNLVAAGVIVSDSGDGSLKDGCDPLVPFQWLTFLCVTLSVLALTLL